MRKVKEILLKYRLFRLLAGIARIYLNNYALRKSKKKEQKWLAQFTSNGDSFIYSLEINTLIRLYKDSILSRLIYEGSFEQNEIEFLKRNLKEGDIFIDIGANIGLYSLIASSKVGDSGRIIAFEPSPLTFSRLENNIVLNSFRNIEPRNIGLSDANGILKLNISESGHDAWNTFASKSDGKFNRSKDVPVYTLDEQLRDVQKDKVSLIKVDVEGWEKFVLIGGKGFLNNYSPIVMVEFTESNTSAAGYNVRDIYDLLVDWGYKWYKYKNGKLKEEESLKQDADYNLIAIKKVADVTSVIH